MTKPHVTESYYKTLTTFIPKYKECVKTLENKYNVGIAFWDKILLYKTKDEVVREVIGEVETLYEYVTPNMCK
jgi:hypothetical protein